MAVLTAVDREMTMLLQTGEFESDRQYRQDGHHVGTQKHIESTACKCSQCGTSVSVLCSPSHTMVGPGENVLEDLQPHHHSGTKNGQYVYQRRYMHSYGSRPVLGESSLQNQMQVQHGCACLDMAVVGGAELVARRLVHLAPVFPAQASVHTVERLSRRTQK